MLLALSSVDLLDKIKANLKLFAEVFDLGHIHWLFDFEIRQDYEAHSLAISQGSCIESIVKHYCMKETMPLFISMDSNVNFLKFQSPMTATEIAGM